MNKLLTIKITIKKLYKVIQQHFSRQEPINNNNNNNSKNNNIKAILVNLINNIYIKIRFI